MVASLPMRMGGLGLPSAGLCASAAYWVSWPRQSPIRWSRVWAVICSTSRRLRSTPRLLADVGPWGIQAGIRPPDAAEDEPGEWQHGWQCWFSSVTNGSFEKLTLFSGRTASSRDCGIIRGGVQASRWRIAPPHWNSPNLISSERCCLRDCKWAGEEESHTHRAHDSACQDPATKFEMHFRTCSSLWPSCGNDDGRECWPLRCLLRVFPGGASAKRNLVSHGWWDATPRGTVWGWPQVEGRVELKAFWIGIETVCFACRQKKKRKNLTKEDGQRTTMLTDDKKERLRKTKDLHCMMAHALASTTLADSPSVSCHFTHCRGFSLCASCHQFNLSLYHSIQFLTCARILCTISHCESGSFYSIVFTPPVSYNRPTSTVNDLTAANKEQFVKIESLRFDPKTAGFPVLSCRIEKLNCGLSFDHL